MRKHSGLTVLALAMLLGLGACGGGGDGDGESTVPTIGDAAIKSATVVAQTEAPTQPVDAAPSPDGSTIYYLTTGDRGPALLEVAAEANSPSTTLAEGAAPGEAHRRRRRHRRCERLHRRPAGSPGQRRRSIRRILVAPTSGAADTHPASGTEGRAPKGLDVVSDGGADVVYFTGTDPANGNLGLFRVPAAGGAVTTVAAGAPFVSPDSVVVSARGVGYVTDQGSGTGKGQVIRVSEGAVTPVLSDLRLGTPAGVTLAPGDGTLLVSSIDASTSSDQVLFLHLASGTTAAAAKVVGANKDSSGGLHRAHASPVLAWADVQRRQGLPGRPVTGSTCNRSTYLPSASPHGQPAPAGLLQQGAGSGGSEEEQVGGHRPALPPARRQQGEGRLRPERHLEGEAGRPLGEVEGRGAGGCRPHHATIFRSNRTGSTSVRGSCRTIPAGTNTAQRRARLCIDRASDPRQRRPDGECHAARHPAPGRQQQGPGRRPGHHERPRQRQRPEQQRSRHPQQVPALVGVGRPVHPRGTRRPG